MRYQNEDRNKSVIHLHCHPLTESWKTHPFYCLSNTYYANPVHHQDAWYSNQELLIRYPNSRNSSLPSRNDFWFFFLFVEFALFLCAGLLLSLLFSPPSFLLISVFFPSYSTSYSHRIPGFPEFQTLPIILKFLSDKRNDTYVCRLTLQEIPT